MVVGLASEMGADMVVVVVGGGAVWARMVWLGLGEVEAGPEGTTDDEMAAAAAAVVVPVVEVAALMAMEMGIGMRMGLRREGIRSLGAETGRVVGEFCLG